MANQTKSVTIENLEAAFAGESMAHINYRYFARLARAAGAIEVAEAFEATADQEVAHAFGHLDLLYPKNKMTPARRGFGLTHHTPALRQGLLAQLGN